MAACTVQAAIFVPRLAPFPPAADQRTGTVIPDGIPENNPGAFRLIFSMLSF
jgi:hypothetical protein